MGITLLALSFAAFDRALWPLALVGLPLLPPLLKRARNARVHFAQGEVNAAKVVDPKTGLVACFADLGKHAAAPFPTVRLLNYPLAEMTGGPFASGDDLPAVSVYYGAPGGHKWDSFNPVPAACATADPDEIARLHGLVPEWQWMFLNEALFRIPRPYLPGIYPVPTEGELTFANMANDG